MLHILCLGVLCVLAEVRWSLQYSKKIDRMNSNLSTYDDIIPEIQREEFFLTEVKESQNSDFLQGSGDFEGSGFGSERTITKDLDNTSNCVESGYTSVCSNKGRCIKNKCICESTQIEIENTTIFYRYSGRYCEECPFCRALRCHKYLSCIECLSFQTNCSVYCQFKYEIVEKVQYNIDKEEKLCDVDNLNGCFFKFKYYYDSENLPIVQFERDPICFNGLNYVIIISIGVIVYAFTLTLVPRKCCLSKKSEVRKSRTSLSTRHDVLRFNISE